MLPGSADQCISGNVYLRCDIREASTLGTAHDNLEATGCPSAWRWRLANHASAEAQHEDIMQLSFHGHPAQCGYEISADMSLQ